MSAFYNNALVGASGQGEYTIEESLRFNASQSSYLSWTPASAGNRKTWTFSAWVKRGTLGAAQVLFCSDVGTSNSTWLELGFNAGDTLTLQGYTTDISTTVAVFRDPSAWYHVVVAFDTTQATSANRCKIYVNGIQQTLTDLGFTLNADYGINNAQAHGIGYRNWASGVGRYFDGYLTEVNFIDGQALDPSSFGEFDGVTGVWKPAKYTGTYGTNGFYLPFSDNTNTTTLVADSSGNGNDWTPNNISLTSGATYDSMTDTPTPYADGGNYATWNPLISALNGNSTTQTFSNGNLQVVTPNTSHGKFGGSSTVGMSGGKWYSEVTVASAGGSYPNYTTIGITGDPWYNAVNTNASIGFQDYSVAYYNSGGLILRNNSTVFSTGVTQSAPYTCMVAVDIDASKVYFGINGTWLNSADPSAGTGGFSILDVASTPTGEYFIGCFSSSSQMTATYVANFGQRPFAYTPPTGFKALHTGNLPDSAIVDGSQYFNAVTYTGNGYPTSGAQSISTVNFQPDFVWIKDRSRGGYNHFLQDVLRGSTNVLRSNTTGAANTESTAVTSFNADGFSLGANNEVNYQNDAFISWNWKANGAGVSNTDGSITSTVSANPTAGFSIVTYTGTGSVATVGHGLNSPLDMFIIKNRDRVENWPVYARAVGNGGLFLDGTNAYSSSSSFTNNTDPSSSVFTLGTNAALNVNGEDCVAYCFAEVEGYSKFGKYTGNGSADGPFVYLGFRPRWILVKDTSSSGNYWLLHDTSRSPFNLADKVLFPNLSNAEATQNGIDILSNGFKTRTSGSNHNSNGNTYIYMAFAENPFKNSLAR